MESKSAAFLSSFEFDEDESEDDEVMSRRDDRNDLNQDLGIETNVVGRERIVEKNKKTEKNKESKDDDGLIVKQKREVVSLTPAKLLAPNGFPSLKNRFSNFKPSCVTSGLGDELSDLNRMFEMYESWAENLGVREGSQLPEFIDKLDRIKKNEVRRYIQKMRDGDSKLGESQQPPAQVSSQPIVSASNQASQFPSTTATTTISPLEPPVQLSEEAKALIQKKKEDAMKLRTERLKQTNPTIQPLPTTFTQQDESQTLSQTVVNNIGLVDTQAPTQIVEVAMSANEAIVEENSIAHVTPTNEQDTIQVLQEALRDTQAPESNNLPNNTYNSGFDNVGSTNSIPPTQHLSQDPEDAENIENSVAEHDNEQTSLSRTHGQETEKPRKALVTTLSENKTTGELHTTSTPNETDDVLSKRIRRSSIDSTTNGSRLL
jgi:hypothetical protein